MLSIYENRGVVKKWLDTDDNRYTVFQYVDIDRDPYTQFIYRVYYTESNLIKCAMTRTSDAVLETELYERIYLPLKAAIQKTLN